MSFNWLQQRAQSASLRSTASEQAMQAGGSTRSIARRDHAAASPARAGRALPAAEMSVPSMTTPSLPDFHLMDRRDFEKRLPAARTAVGGTP